jgi:EmrB/QacA subfamily drug resistance transporter
MNQTNRASISDGRRWWVLAVISFSLFMILLDVTIVNIAIPHIMTGFNVGLSSIEWVLNVYVLVFAVLLLTMGKLGDLFGRRLLFLLGLIVFTLSSLGCFLSPNFAFLLVMRGIQAVGGAAMMPATLSLLNVEFGQSGRGLALGIWGAVAGAANALGPIIGGKLVDAYSWPYIFLINVPIGILGILGTIFIVRESKDPRIDHRIDYVGVVIVSLALFCLTFALVEGQKYGWTSAGIIALFSIAAVATIIFVWIELHVASPLAQLSLFRDRSFAAGNIVGLVITFGLIGVIFLLVLFLQIILGFDALTAGVTVLPLPIGIMVVAPFAGRLTDRIGGRWVLFAGTFLAALGIYLMSDLSSVTSGASLRIPLAVCGAGMGMVMAPVTTVVMAGTPIQQSGMGAGILSTMRQIGSVMGISVLGAILQNQLVSNMKAALINPPFSQLAASVRDQIVQGITTSGLGGLSGGSQNPLSGQIADLFKTEFAHSLDNTMKVGIAIILVGTVASLFISSHIRGVKKINRLQGQE